MADVKISGLPAATIPLAGTELVPIVQSGVTKKAAVVDFTNRLNLGTIATQNANSVTVTGGSINGTTVGATTASTGAFSNLSYTGALTGGTGIVNLGSGQVYKNASGNVGIGTSTVLQKLSIRGAPFPSSSFNGQAIEDESAERIRIGYKNGTPDTGLIPAQIIADLNLLQIASSDNASSGVTFRTGSGILERMRITPAGDVGIGTVSPSTKLQVIGTVASSGTAGRQGTGGTSNGNDINFWWAGSNLQAWVDTTNVGNITLTSDYRIKKDIETQTLTAINRIVQLRPVTYKLADYKTLYKADGVNREGFIAHELAEIIPSAVDGKKDAEDQIQSLKLDALCSVMVKAIQEQQAMIETLTQRITALEGN